MSELSSFRNALTRRLLAGAGMATVLAAVGCGDSTSGNTGGAGGAGGAGGDGGAGAATSSAGGAGSTSAATTDTSTGGSGGAGGATTTTTATGSENVERCFAAAGAECPALEDAAALFGACTADGEAILQWLSGPTVAGTDCCYQVDVSAPGDPSCGIAGRPFVVAGRARVAPVTPSARGWSARESSAAPRPFAPAAPTATPLVPDTTGLDAATRGILGRAWARDAAYEHASVASFGKLALELLAFGAPADLVRAAHDAAVDEIRHAQISFALAAAYLAAPVGPGALPEARAFTGAATLADLAAAAVLEGCVGETLTAVVAAAQREAATDPAVREALAVLAEEESRHAELAFRVVAWALAAGAADVRARVHETFLQALTDLRRAEAPALDAAPNAALLRAHGHLSPAELVVERRRAAEEIVTPAMACLLGADA